jgi:hypothetical protein
MGAGDQDYTSGMREEGHKYMEQLGKTYLASIELHNALVATLIRQVQETRDELKVSCAMCGEAAALMDCVNSYTDDIDPRDVAHLSGRLRAQAAKGGTT